MITQVVGLSSSVSAVYARNAWDHDPPPLAGVTTSRATSGGRRKDRNTSGQLGNNFNTSYRDISVIVVENNSVVKPEIST